MVIINNWFSSGCDYASGVAIYGSLAKHNPTLLKTLQKKESSFNSEKLKYELKKFITADEVIIQIISPKIPITAVSKRISEKAKDPQKIQSILFHQLPEQLRPVLLEANQLFKENCMLKVSLNELPAHAEKAAIDLQIKIYNNIKRNELCWQKIDLFLEKRIIIESTISEFDHLTAAGLLRHQQLLYASISKLNTRLNANREMLKRETLVASRSKLERAISKQEENLLNKKEQLITISKLIDGK